MKTLRIIVVGLFLLLASSKAWAIWRIDFNIPLSYNLSASVKDSDDDKLVTDGSPFGTLIIFEPKYNIGIGYESISQGLKYNTFDNVTSKMEHRIFSLTYSFSTQTYRFLVGLGSGEMNMNFKDGTTKFSGKTSVSKFTLLAGYRFDTALDIHLGYNMIPSFSLETEDDQGNTREIEASVNFFTFGANYGF